MVLVLLLLVVGIALLGSGGRTAANQGADAPVEEPEAANEGAANSPSPTSSASASASASPNAGAPVPDKECSVGQECDLGTGTVTLNAAEYTNEVTAKYEGAKSGNFVVAEFDYTYNGKTTASTGEPPWLVEDEDERVYSYDFDTTNYYTDLEESVLNVEVQPGVSIPGRVIFSVAPDAKGPFTLYISDLVNPQGGDVARVDL